MVILGIDFGEKRLGLAKSDELGFMAHSIGYLDAVPEERFFLKLKDLMDELQVNKIVVGLPKTLKGETGTQAKKVLLFMERLMEKVSCPVVSWDERLTTVQAEKALLAQDVSRKKRREKRDSLAAEIMLQSYLDFSKHKGTLSDV